VLQYAFDAALWRRLGGAGLAGGWVARSTPAHCGKLAALVELLGRWAAGGRDKVLLFSHSTRALDLLQEVAERQVGGKGGGGGIFTLQAAACSMALCAGRWRKDMFVLPAVASLQALP
jgi:hypothetical protein